MNEVIVGRKPLIKYAYAIIEQLKNGDVVVKARGRNTSKAIDAVEFVKNRNLAKFKIKDIKISSDKLVEGSRQRYVSTIEIELTKK